MKNLYRVTLDVDIPAESPDEAKELARGILDGNPLAASGGILGAVVSPEDTEYQTWMKELSEMPRGEQKVLTIGRGQPLFALMAAVATMGGESIHPDEPHVLSCSQVETPHIVLSQDTPESGVNRTVIPPKLYKKGKR